MSRRAHGPKRRANAYAQRVYLDVGPSEIKAALTAAWMAGYGAAARVRRGPPAAILTAEEREALLGKRPA
jgi:hypothetical protein